MKRINKKLLCLLLAVLMIFSLTACGKDKAADPNLIKLGDYELLYKGARIMEDTDGNDAIVLTLDFKNNGKKNASYLWSVDETVMQNGVELEVASVITDYETFESVADSQFADVAPGATLEVETAFVLNDTTSEIKATFEELFGTKTARSPSTRPSSAARRRPALTSPAAAPSPVLTRLATSCSTGGTANGTAGGR